MLSVRTVVTVSGLLLAALPVYAQAPAPAATAAAAATNAPAAIGGVPAPADYVIGPDDVLDVIFWKEEASSSKDVVVRPDGKVGLTLLNELQAAGKTPEQFRAEVIKAAQPFFTDPTVSVNIKQINSRRVYISGNVVKVNAYALGQPITVSQLISMAGGLQEYAKGKKIVIVRRLPDGTDKPFDFNYDEVSKGKNLQQDIYLKPGDRVFVP